MIQSLPLPVLTRVRIPLDRELDFRAAKNL